MQTPDRPAQPSGLNLADVYYGIFRHKWKIILLSAAGLAAAAVVYFVMPAAYSSEAKLLIRYVVESKVPSGIAGDTQIKNPDPRGDNIINSEIEVLQSLDLATQVVDAIGAEKILGPRSAETNRYLAAAVLQKNLKVQVPRNSNVLRISFQHPDREVVQPVLTKLIEVYLRRHVEIHRSIGAFDDLLTQQTDALRAQLAQTEQDLQRARTNAGVISIEDSKKAYAEAIARTREELFNTQAELVERQATLEARQKLLPVKTETPSEKPEAEVPADKVDEYRRILGRLDFLRKREQELLTQYTEANPLVSGIREQIAPVEKMQKQLEADYPRLTRIQPPSAAPAVPVVDLSEDIARVNALQAKLKVVNAYLEKLMAEAKTVTELEPAITQLQRKKELEETKYRHFSTSLEQARFDEALSAGKNSNISVPQAPSPPYRESRDLVKTLSILAIGGIVLGFALAFLIELFLDPSVRRPAEFENRLRLPLFLTIPWMPRKSRLALAAPAATGSEPAKDQTTAVVPYNGNGMVTYCEALRDRLVTYFEIHNLVHKPKLIAVTGCGKGAGVTTIASGLAASLSETGDGNVLVVDMNTDRGAAHPFFKGKPCCALTDALTSDKRENALVQENLYAVAETNSKGQLPRALPRRFNHLLPQLRASDYDYIIFDMPAVSQISVTPRLAGFMDMVLLVVESEKTDRDVVKRATAMLAESRANVRAILNKNRPYVPQRLSQDL